MHHIAEVERNNIREKLKNARFLSVMSEGTTDSSVKGGGEELVYVRLYHQGKIDSKFVGIKLVEKADTAHIGDAVNNIMDPVGDDWGS